MKHSTTNDGPIWGDPPITRGSRLAEDARADACVVGAGIAGMSTAYELVRQGKSVIVLDDGPVGGGQTGRTTAHLASALDDRFFTLEELRGIEAVRLAAESHAAAIDRIEHITRQESITCDFERVDGYLFNGGPAGDDVLNRELATLRRANLATVEPMLRAPIPSFDTGPCLRFPGQGQFQPLRYLHGLAEAIQRGRSRIFQGARAERIQGGSPATVTTKAGPVIEAGAVVVATNIPVNDLLAIHTKQAAYLTYALAAHVPKGTITRALYWDTLDPYHYVRLHSAEQSRSIGRKSGEWLIVGGEDHKTGQADDGQDRHGRLEAWARERFPMIERIGARWSGQVVETLDGLAFIGRNPLDTPNVFVATGDSGMGMTHGVIAGMLITDLILGRENPWTWLYDPSRRPLRGLLGFVGETLNMASQYRDWFTGSEVDSLQKIPNRSGAVIRSGLQKLAVYRDETGEFHAFKATCPHLGCIVRWNDSAKTWDCPCHGSRFACDGRVINGPANRGLGVVAEASLAHR
jgi:glycine/D-amino acid oxidase-like deaminating enzyme/nitrite reductase/ring-hydroxylating ferredoxin subunit